MYITNGLRRINIRAATIEGAIEEAQAHSTRLNECFDLWAANGRWLATVSPNPECLVKA